MNKRAEEILNMLNDDSNNAVDSKSSSTLEFNMELGNAANKTDDDASSISVLDSTNDSSSNCSTSCDSSTSYDNYKKERKKRVFSKINENWKYFEVLNDKEAKCSLCCKIIKTSGNTSNINYHIDKKHSNSKLMQFKFLTIQVFYNILFLVKLKSQNQPTLNRYGFDVSKVKTKEEITLMICEMIIRDLQPISIVQDEGFCKLLNFFAPDYKIPCRETITKRIEKIFENEEAELVKELERAVHIAVTTDGWTSQQTQKLFATYTVAYVDPEKGLLKNKVLRTNRFAKAHTGVNIYEDMESTFKDFKISGKIN